LRGDPAFAADARYREAMGQRATTVAVVALILGSALIVLGVIGSLIVLLH
jgi:hypothetical protein